MDLAQIRRTVIATTADYDSLFIRARRNRDGTNSQLSCDFYVATRS